MGGISDRLQEMGFGRPRGLVGRVGGWLMAKGNAGIELHLVERAELQPDEEVLVVGPGPGVGLCAAAGRARRVVGVDPSETMLAACRQRCAASVDAGTVELVRGEAADTGRPDGSADVVLSVNNVMLWPDWRAGFTELRRVLRPGGRILVSAHDKWLPGGLTALAAAVGDAGFVDIETWMWEPPGRIASTAAQLRARRGFDAGLP